MNELALNLMRFRKLNGLTQQAIAEAAGISRVAYRNLEKGAATPREGTLQSLAGALNTSALELLSPVPQLQSLRFRANKKLSEQERAQSDLLTARSANWLNDFNELEQILDVQRDCRIKAVPKTSTPEAAAKKAREQLLGEKSGCDCMPDLCELLENSGIKLFLYDFKMINLFGLSIGKPDGGPAIAINTGKNISVERQIFSLAHELGHLLMHKDSYNGAEMTLEQEEQEQEANRFAAAFLMPKERFLAEWNENRGLHWVDAVLKTKRHFKVSYQVVLRQLIDLEKIQDENVNEKFRTDYQNLYQKEVREKEEPRGLDPFDLMEDRFATLVRDALDKELITTSRAAEILDVSIEEMRQRMKSWEVVK